MYSARQLRELTSGLDEESWVLLEYILEAADSSMTYRSSYYTTLQPVAVLDVLMADEYNPRSLNFQLAHLADLYGKLSRHAPDDLKAIQQAVTLMRGLDLEKLELPLPGNNPAAAESEGQLQLRRALSFVEELLPAWADRVLVSSSTPSVLYTLIEADVIVPVSE